MTAYDVNNIFAKILRGEFPCYKVYEDPKGAGPQHPRY
jgi:histidine triad (HIT) family protein